MGGEGQQGVTIIMYHYVRDLARTRYPAIKGRDLTSFRGQLDHLARHYTVMTAEEILSALKTGEALPANAPWLTFDDGYDDHYSVVFPLLHERGWQGSFFPPARAVQHGELLDVNQIHFILAAEPDPARIISAIRKFLDEHQDEAAMRRFADYWVELARASRFDTAEVMFIKRLLQHSLPEPMRALLVPALFKRFVSVDPIAFAAELYVTPEQLRTMIRCGMYVGGHGARHYWPDRLDLASQTAEIDASLDFLWSLGAPTDDWVMCYPYGAYNDTLLALLQARNCAVGLTTKVAIARPGIDAMLELPRIDTNDLPISAYPQ